MTKALIRNRNTIFKRYKTSIIIITFALIAAATIVIWADYRISSASVGKTDPYITDSKLPYVDGSDASDHVANFYRQYIDPRTPSTARDKLIEGYGNKNLLFYSQYYRHGFDPITCSADVPIKVSTSLIATGPVAMVNAVAEKPDGTRDTITAKVILDDEGLSIDSIKCPGAKGNLPPAE